MMRPLSCLLLLFGVIFLSWGVVAVTTSMVNHQVPIDPIGLAPVGDFTPLLVRESSIQKIWENEHVAFLNVRKSYANSADSERALVQEQLILQRTNLLHAHLNGLVLDFQKMDYLVDRFPSMLVRLRSVYDYGSETAEVVGFDDEYSSLQSSLRSLEASHMELRESILDVSKNYAESREPIEELSTTTAGQMKSVQEWLHAYVLLLRKVV